MHIAADHLFFKHVGLSSERATVAEMVYHMGMADRVFRATDFNQDGGSGDGIGFVITAVTVFHNETSEGRLIKINVDKDQGEAISATRRVARGGGGGGSCLCHRFDGYI